MIKAQAKDHLTMSRDLSEKQKTLDRQKLLRDEQRLVRSGYARAMAIDALRANQGDMKTKGGHRWRCCFD
jgi:hypothetical protein